MDALLADGLTPLGRVLTGSRGDAALAALDNGLLGPLRLLAGTGSLDALLVALATGRAGVGAGAGAGGAFATAAGVDGCLSWAITLRGGVMGLRSKVLDEKLCVGRIIRAKKASSTWPSRLATGWSWASFFGGGPRLGRGRLITEFWRLSSLTGGTVESGIAARLARLSARLPGTRAATVLDCEAAVGWVSEGGRATGLVGDFGLGLIKPVPELLGDDVWD